jgi:very-short-patch-repair endonuclease
VRVEGRIHRDIGGQGSTRSIAELAARQHGLVARRQLALLGLGEDAIDYRVARGLLHRTHRGVYAVGHTATTGHAVWMAAVLAAGPDAVVSHRSAAALWGVRDTHRSSAEVTCPRRLDIPGVDSHRTVLPPDEVTVEHGIPVTTPARTLFDLAAVVTEQQLRHALNEAEIRRLASPLSLDALIARHPRRKGTQALKSALDTQRQTGETITKSRLERRFLELVDAHGLPRPKMNHPLGPYEPDALWPEQRLVVELDSYGIHTTRQAFEQDRARDRALTLAGYRVVRITWRQLTTHADALAQQLRAMLGDATPPPRSAHRARPRSPATRSAAP